ncbi:unnamed protein product, partial [marine sediment metagenome]
PGKELPVARPDFFLRWKMCNKMKEVDPDVNFYSIRPLSHEFMNFVDGNRTIEEIANAVGYEYDMKIKGEHVLIYFTYFKDKGLLTFSHK